MNSYHHFMTADDEYPVFDPALWNDAVFLISWTPLRLMMFEWIVL